MAPTTSRGAPGVGAAAKGARWPLDAALARGSFAALPGAPMPRASLGSRPLSCPAQLVLLRLQLHPN